MFLWFWPAETYIVKNSLREKMVTSNYTQQIWWHESFINFFLMYVLERHHYLFPLTKSIISYWQGCSVSDGFTWHKSTNIAIKVVPFFELIPLFPSNITYLLILWCWCKTLWSPFYVHFYVFKTFLLNPHSKHNKVYFCLAITW